MPASCVVCPMTIDDFQTCPEYCSVDFAFAGADSILFHAGSNSGKIKKMLLSLCPI